MKCEEMAKMNDQLPEERLATSGLFVFLKIYLYDSASKFQE